ncbi:MAG TPA: CBASS cGAMP synthase [Ancylobacter sp.]
MGLNYHRVFTGPSGADSYLATLTLEGSREKTLRDARDECREAIREGLRHWSSLVTKNELFERIFADNAPTILKPKFRMQGSFVYRTLNDPAYAPPQQIDLDDGVFLPVSFLKEQGRDHPALVSAGYFQAVESVLKPVCDTHGWKLKGKSTCVRVELDQHAHIDFALYAIPDDEFTALLEAELFNKAMDARNFLRDHVEFSEPLYQRLQEDQIMLAHREEGWKPSDPRKLEDWFKKALSRHGEQIRRVSRYLKGWRDFRWESCRLSSITLMACVVTVYNEAAQGLVDDRDDLALLTIAAQMPIILSGRVANPVVEGQYLDESWTESDRQSFIEEAKALHDRLLEATSGTDSAVQGLTHLVRAFGDRLPNDTDLITSDSAPPISGHPVLSYGLLNEIASETAPQQAVIREGDRRYG